MKNKFIFLVCFALAGCDLQPKIASIPDDIGSFIETRYPALLADPETQPEIYNSAVTDYGVYASPELYGNERTDDYVLYASVDDYVLIPQSQQPQEKPAEQNINSDSDSEPETEQYVFQDNEQDYLIVPLYGGSEIIDKQPQIEPIKAGSDIIVARGDTVYSLARRSGLSMEEFAKINNLHEPYIISVGQKLKTRADKPAQTEIVNVISQEKVQEITKTEIKTDVKPNNVKRVDLDEITVVAGDTLYSLSRKYQIPVNDLAVMNKLQSPFVLSVGQKIKVPKLDAVEKRSATEITQVKHTKQVKKITPATKVSRAKSANQPQIKVVKNKTETKQSVVQKHATEPKKVSVEKTVKKTTTPKIVARSNSKFSWPIRGRILSGYGSKKNGLFNDGINIAGNIGNVVKSAENGVVAYAGNEVKGMGNLIIIQHSDGWMSVYAHLDSMSVKRGAKVSVGQQIGKIGKTGKVDKPQLHFEIRRGTKAYNPINYLK